MNEHNGWHPCTWYDVINLSSSSSSAAGADSVLKSKSDIITKFISRPSAVTVCKRCTAVSYNNLLKPISSLADTQARIDKGLGGLVTRLPLTDTFTIIADCL